MLKKQRDKPFFPALFLVLLSLLGLSNTYLLVLKIFTVYGEGNVW
jgi:hypothetical protein